MARDSENRANLTRIGRIRAADLGSCVYITPHAPPRKQNRSQIMNNAANMARGAGRDAAVTPAGEGGRERGAGWWEKGGNAAHRAPRSKPSLPRRSPGGNIFGGGTDADEHAVGAPCCRPNEPVIR